MCAQSQTLPLSAPLVLIVDHDEDNREMYRIGLTHSGFRVTLADAALAQFGREAAEVVVMDVVLPDCDGIELCRKVRQQCTHARTKLIVLTAVMLKQPEIARVMTAGADLLLFKPCLPEALVEEIRDMLGHPVAR